MSDIEIAQHATMQPIIALAKEQYGSKPSTLIPLVITKPKYHWNTSTA